MTWSIKDSSSCSVPQYIHPSITACPAQGCRVVGLIPTDTGRDAGYILDRMPVWDVSVSLNVNILHSSGQRLYFTQMTKQNGTRTVEVQCLHIYKFTEEASSEGWVIQLPFYLTLLVQPGLLLEKVWELTRK